MKKSELIREIIIAVNMNADRTKKRVNGKHSKTADANLLFSLAFRTEEELNKIYKSIK